MPGSCEAVRALDGVDGAEAGAVGAGARSQWAMQLRVVRGGKDRYSEFNPEADVAKVGCSGTSSKAGGNLERPSAMILSRLDVRGDDSF